MSPNIRKGIIKKVYCLMECISLKYWKLNPILDYGNEDCGYDGSDDQDKEHLCNLFLITVIITER